MAVCSGFLVTVVLSLSSILAIRFVPYGDLPMMPKPFFIYTLAPGLIATEFLNVHGLWRSLTFVTANTLAYAIAFWVFTRIWADWMGALKRLRTKA